MRFTSIAHQRYMDALGVALAGDKHRAYRLRHPFRYQVFVLLCRLHLTGLAACVIKGYPNSCV